MEIHVIPILMIVHYHAGRCNQNTKKAKKQKKLKKNKKTKTPKKKAYQYQTS